MKIAFLYTTDVTVADYERALCDYEVIYFEGTIAQCIDKIPTDIDALCIWLDSRIDQAVLQRFKKLRLIVTRTVGFDHIDLAATKKAGVCVCYAPRYAGPAVAECAIGMMLALARKTIPTYLAVCAGDFSRAGLCGFELAGKTLGVLGTGDIGLRVVRLAHAFGMQVLACDRCPNADLTREKLCTYTELKQLYAKSDILSLHVPYCKETYHMINRSMLGKLKPGMYLINTARGEIAETAALAQGLRIGVFAGLALDVIEHLPTDDENIAYLMQQINVLITPHNAFNTAQARKRLVPIAKENIDAFVAGKPINVVA